MRNSREGASTAARARRSRGPSNCISASDVYAALMRSDRRRQLIGQHLINTAMRRIDHQVDFLVGGNARALLRQVDRLVQPAELVDQAELLGLLARPDPALRHFIDLLRRHVPRRGGALDELVVDVLHRLFDLLPLVRA